MAGFLRVPVPLYTDRGQHISQYILYTKALLGPVMTNVWPVQWDLSKRLVSDKCQLTSPERNDICGNVT